MWIHISDLPQTDHVTNKKQTLWLSFGNVGNYQIKWDSI